MSRSSKLSRIMKEELPSLSYQRRMLYRTTEKEVLSLFRILNREVFNNKLSTPKFEVVSNCRDYWGFCIGDEYGIEEVNKKSSHCLLRVSDKWFCKQWLVMMLAHEMCHQYQWDVIGKRRMKRGKEPHLSHGPTFFIFKEKLARFGIPLNREATSKDHWFSYQSLF
jgi:hypothetical protein